MLISLARNTVSLVRFYLRPIDSWSPSQHYCIEGIKGDPQLKPHYAESHVSLSNIGCNFSRVWWATTNRTDAGDSVAAVAMAVALARHAEAPVRPCLRPVESWCTVFARRAWWERNHSLTLSLHFFRDHWMWRWNRFNNYFHLSWKTNKKLARKSKSSLGINIDIGWQ